jgi:uncharacterized OsmC-like protein
MTYGTPTLRERQATLRAKIARDPAEAISTKRVRSAPSANTDAVHGTVYAVDHEGCSWAYGIDESVGGFDDLPNPGHLLCAALAACLDSAIRMIADNAGVTIEHLSVDVVGDADVRGCLAIDRDVRPGFRKIDCRVDLRLAPESDPRWAGRLIDKAERLCVTLDTLRNGVPISVSSMDA